MGNRKSSRTKKRSNSSSKGILRTILIFILLLLSGYLVYVAYNVFSYEIRDSLTSKANESYLIETKGLEKTVIVIGDKEGSIKGVWQIAYDSESVDTVAYFIPPWVYSIDYSGVFDQYISVGDYEYAGSVLDEKRDIEYSLWQLINLTAVPSDSYIWITDEGMDSFEDIFGEVAFKNEKEDLEVLLNKYSVVTLLFNSQKLSMLDNKVLSNLNKVDLHRRLSTIKEILRLGDVSWVDLSEDYATEEVVTETGKIVPLVNTSGVDNQLDKYMYILRNRELEKEQVKVEVFNGSEVAGAASRYARRVRNAGLKVVRYDNAPEATERTVVYVADKDRFKESVSMVQRLLSVGVQMVEGRPEFMTTGDVVIILGSDLKGEMSWER
jgi:hypothetical protein